MSKVESFFAVVCLFVDFVVIGYSGAVAVQGAVGMAQAHCPLTVVSRQLTAYTELDHAITNFDAN